MVSTAISPTPNSDDRFGLSVRFLADQVEVAVSGNLDTATAPNLDWVLAGLLDRGYTHVVLDLTDLAWLDTSGLQVIAGISGRLEQAGGVLRIRNPSVTTRRLLDLNALRGVELEATDADAAVLGSEQRAGDESRTVAAAPALAPVDATRVAAMPAGADLVDAALELVTALAQATVGGADGVSVSLARAGKLTTIAATDDTIAQMDRDQYATGQGPCLAAAAQGHWFHIESLAEEDRWPAFVPRARDGGIGSILSTPLLGTGDRPVGALNIYSRSDRAFGPAEQELAALFATQASRIVTDARADVAAEEAAQRFQDALRVREIIAHAQGVLMAQEGVTAEAAYAILCRSSRQSGVTVHRQATGIVAAVQPPGSSAAGDP